MTLQIESRTQLPSGVLAGEGPQMRFYLSPSGTGNAMPFDLSDLGATPTRNVSVRIVDERRL